MTDGHTLCYNGSVFTYVRNSKKGRKVESIDTKEEDRLSDIKRRYHVKFTYL